MSIIQGTAKATAGDTDFYSFPIGQSLRFDGSSHLSRTFGTVSGSYTFSVWIKRTSISSDKNTIISTQSSYPSATNVYPDLGFLSDDKLTYYDSQGGVNNSSSSGYRDISSWYHIVMFWDGTNQNVYVNGGTTAVVSSTGKFEFSGKPSYIGKSYSTAPNDEDYFNGYMAEINFIDGQALTPTSFGEFKNGVWVPKDPSGLTYGNNGFRLNFSDATSKTTLGYDVSLDSSGNPNHHHWTLN